MDWSGFRVELLRHIGAKKHETLGLLPIEHPQKRVLVYGPGKDTPTECGILPDHRDQVLWMPDYENILKDSKGLMEFIQAEALKARAEQRFTDPDPASYFYAGHKRPEAK